MLIKQKHKNTKDSNQQPDVMEEGSKAVSITSGNMTAKPYRYLFSRLRLPGKRQTLLIMIVLLVVGTSGFVAYNAYSVHRTKVIYAQNGIVPIKTSKEFDKQYRALQQKTYSDVKPTEQDYLSVLNAPGEKPYYFYEDMANYYENHENAQKSVEFYTLAKEAYIKAQKDTILYRQSIVDRYDTKITRDFTNHEE